MKVKAIKNILKTIKYKWVQTGEERKADKARKKQKSNEMPPQYKYRKAGIIAFWSAFGFMLLMCLLMLFAIIGGGGKNNQQKVKAEPQNHATMQPAVEFSKEFAEKYLSYKSKEDREKRTARLSPYFIKEMEDGSGVEFPNDKEIESSVENVDLKGIEESGKDRSYITLKVDLKQTEYKTEKKEKEVKDGKKKKKVKEDVKVPKEHKVSKYLTIPVIYKNGSYAVYEYPQFTKVEENKAVSYKNNNDNLVPTTGKKNEVKEFLNTFFDVYANESKDKIAYMLSDGVNVNTMEGNLQFVEIEDVEIFNEKDDSNKLTTVVDVKFKDDVGTIYTSRYHIELAKKDGKYVVTQFGESK